MRRLLLPLLLATSLLGACASVVNPVTGRSERSVMDEPTEIAEGRKAHEAVMKEYTALDNPQVQAYVNDLGQRLAKQSHRAQLQWTFTVLDSPEVNAFALPGGYVYVTRGIMAYMESEADLAGVMGHEIGHVTARHGAQRATRQQTAGIGVLAATVLGAVLGVGDVANQVSQSVAAGYIASYSRDQESQADQLGAEYLVRNRYNPKNMVEVIQVLKRQEQFAADTAKAEGRNASGGNDWLASHPSNDQRLRDITAIADGYAKDANYVDEGRDRYLQAVAGLPFGESRAQGVTRGRSFYHEPLGIALKAPEGWKVQNSAEDITLVNAAGDAGLVVMLAPAKAGSTHEEIVRNVFKPTQGKFDRLELNGLKASRFTGTATTKQGQARAVVATVVDGPQNNRFVLLQASKDAAALQRNAAGLKEAETSFRALTATDRNAAKPWTLKTASFPRGGFAELAKQSPLPQAEAQLKLINGVYGGGSDPAVGQKIKVVE